MRITHCLVTLAVLAMSLVNVAPVAADGIIIPDRPEMNYLTVKYHRVTVTIADQVATTRVDQVFVNDTGTTVEGSYLFPLPEEAAISEFSMWVNGEPVEGKLLTREEARRIYDDIVRRQRDPALLEYVGRNLFQASIFPVAPSEERRIEIEYREVLPAERGLVRYVYPLSTEKFSPEPLEDASISVSIESREAIKAVYSSSHPVGIDRPDDFRARVGWEARNVTPNKDFVLYYSVAEADLGVNLLSFKERGEDGFFLLLVAPGVDAAQVVARDVILVLDTSGSMEGEKLQQAQDALIYVLEHLNAHDRFNIVAFSTGVATYARDLRPASEASDGVRFVRDLRAEGGTNIDRAMGTALEIAAESERAERPAVIIFLTDGLPTEGEVEPTAILRNIQAAVRPNTRIFTFGVGDDVNTVLLDTMARENRGSSAYVRPGERIDDQVSAFYARIGTPVLADVALDVQGVTISDTYPYPLPDLFAGTQLVLVGRYRAGGPASLTLSGTVNGQTQRFAYDDLTFRDSGGDDFIAPLWATRKIGHLLNQIRLHGESRELVEAIVNLSIRYGIITPYTSFLVQEPDQALSETGRRGIADDAYTAMESAPAAPASGATAVRDAVAQSDLEKAQAPAAPAEEYAAQVRVVGDRAFVYRDGVWTDTTFDPERMTTTRLVFSSPEFFDFLAQHPAAGRFFALGERVIVVLDGVAYETVPA